MQQFNFPTNLLYGQGSLAQACSRIKEFGYKNPLLVTDKTLVKIGLINQVIAELKNNNIEVVIFDDTHPNPIEQDCIDGAKFYQEHNCDAIIAVGGGSPMDAAKGIMVLATHTGPLAKYDDAIGGDKLITNALPPLIAIPTTAGTGSEVGRAGVIIIKETNAKTIIFHPTMMPILSVLEPKLTIDLPPHITAATGIDAFTHSLEAYFSPIFHPMAQGIAIEGMKLCLDNLETAIMDGHNISAREKMLLASSMGATAFQKGLGMIHSIAHPLSSECGLHHGLANALMLPACIRFLASQNLTSQQNKCMQEIQDLFIQRGMAKDNLADSCQAYFEKLGIKFELKNHGVAENQLELLAGKALQDGCHQTNMLPMTKESFLTVIRSAF
ncbi:MAG: iron-containing alcohol dehydrogenase [Halobacteriovoraceae bacterium]|jgi:4-hydroxybutyrate dehydrogenase|nr:iron-containing alcohol dehydrogenase [Halobacteriovoraceae bacterium]